MTVIGKPVPRVDLPGKVYGTHLYIQNLGVPRMLHGRVVRSPRAGATVAAGAFSTATNATGVYSLFVPIGTYTVTADANFYAAASQTGIVVTANTTQTVNFGLSPSRGWIVGTVTSSAGGVLLGATIRITGGGREYSGQTNAQGLYNVTVNPGTYVVNATLTGYVAESQSGIAVAADQEVTVNFALDPVPVPLDPLVLGGIAAAIVIVILAVAAFFLMKRRKKAEEIVSPPPPPSPPPPGPP